MQLITKLFYMTRNTIFCKQLNYCKQRYKPLLFPFQNVVSRARSDIADCDEVEDEDMQEYIYKDLSNECLGVIEGSHNVLILQPYIKWGRDKLKITTRELQMEEAEALVDTLPYWKVMHKMYVPLLSFKKSTLLGYGNFTKLKQFLSMNSNINAIFINLDTLQYYQAKELGEQLNVKVFDRYSLIIHIFRAHAKSPEAKLQVELAEIPYVRRKIGSLSENDMGAINLMEHRKKVLEARETRLKKKIDKLMGHRTRLRINRKMTQIPIVAVVGYTNAGKTSLIKALTGDDSLKPKNKLFATLDTTNHAGLLPSKMKVLYVDTIGFIQNVPEMLIAPFQATLADALDADIIIHVYDASHPDKVAQIQHVEHTIKSFYDTDPPTIINVANKCDLLSHGENVPENDMAVISTNSTGIDLLRERIEKEVLISTNRKVITMRVQSGSPAEAWLYKEMTVIHAASDDNDSQYSILNVITTDIQIYKFKRYLRKKGS